MASDACSNVVARVATVLPHAAVRSGRYLVGAVFAALSLSLVPGVASAQLGIYDALARRFSDVSFFANSGGLYPTTQEVRTDRITSFGIEVLLEIGSVSRPTGPRPERTDTVRVTWREMQVVTTQAGVDTINTYSVERVTPQQPTRDVWVFEMGLGYGQLAGFDARQPGIDLRGTVRDLPALALYANYEPTGTFFGVRSGLMRFQGLQAFDAEGRSFVGEAENFSAGLVLGEAIEIAGISFFVEGAYTFRHFPSIRWTGAQLPDGVPRAINLSGWTVGGGIQFAVGRN
jgi:hypothetical protein